MNFFSVVYVTPELRPLRKEVTRLHSEIMPGCFLLLMILLKKVSQKEMNQTCRRKAMPWKPRSGRKESILVLTGRQDIISCNKNRFCPNRNMRNKKSSRNKRCKRKEIFNMTAGGWRWLKGYRLLLRRQQVVKFPAPTLGSSQ